MGAELHSFVVPIFAMFIIFPMVYPWHQQQLGTLIESLQNYHKNIFTTNFSTRYHPSIINTIHHFSAGHSHYEVNKVHSHSPYT